MGRTLVYTLVVTEADGDRCFFPDPFANGSYLDEAAARQEFEALIAQREAGLDTGRFDKVERGNDFWEAYLDGYYPNRFVRVELLTSELLRPKGKKAGTV